MYHELLLALAGHPGDLFLPDGTVSTAFPHLHPGTREALNRLLPLALTYRDLEYFAAHRCLPSTASSSTTPPSVYLEALAVGFEPILQEYREALTSLERQCIQRGPTQPMDIPATQLPLIEFTLALSPYTLILPRIHAALEHILTADIPGPRILDYLREQSLTGIPELARAISRINQPLCALFYRQIAVWTGWGRVMDPYHELFTPVPPPGHNSRIDVEGSEVSLLEEITGLDVYLDLSRTSSILEPSSAKDMLFIGQAIRALSAHGAITPAEATALGSKHSAELQRLLLSSSSSYSLPSRDLLSRVLAMQRRRVAGRLWKAAVIEYGAAEQLTAFRRFFLLGDGPFADDLSRNLNQGMRGREVEAVWKRISPGTHAEVDPHFPGFKWVPMDKATEKAGPEGWLSDGQIGCGIHFRLGYDLSWPMNLIVSSSDLAQYSTAFSFLFIVKRTLLRLQALLVLPGSLGQCPTYTTLRHRILTWVSALYTHFQMDVIEVGFQELRKKWMSASMASIPTVADSEVSILASVRTTGGRGTDGGDGLQRQQQIRDFEGLHTAHAKYLDRVSRGCLLHTPVLLTAVRAVLRAGIEMCDWAERYYRDVGDGEESDGWEEALSQLPSIQRSFDTQAAFVLRTLMGIIRSSSLPSGSDGAIDASMDEGDEPWLEDEDEEVVEDMVMVGWDEGGNRSKEETRTATVMGESLLDQLLLRLNWNGYYLVSGYSRSSAHG
ncbi:Spc98 family-domain-containing protein [Piptocephalis cylindrospora]|uniref:Spindle pole body component n=1 Tax=Piptocephalis cylindrospora TaxID=1907219 RepID=A0A4P9Y0X3_9FUNG|nr:Spc98 family-domain-containing protein [Piptocephalis cylindrospora]|eukprot:RKP12395.1 Spc98 family-domain-containing protein [Piptocephalis cylindrospora]